jgi:hypothetical protein
MSQYFNGNMEQRFLSYVEKTDSCWLWTGGKCNGYGIFWADKSFRAHRYSYTIYKEPIPVRMIIRHTCDNPSCVNPDHLLVGTSKQNSEDMVDRNRQAKGDNHPARTNPKNLCRGEKHLWAKLTEDDVREIKVLLGFGVSLREIAKQFDVDYTNISNIKRGKTWKHIS